MADLSVQYAGLTLRNPLISAACSLGNHVDKLKRLEDAGIAAVTTKLISSAVQPPEHEFPYRMAYRHAGWLLAGEQNLPLDYGIRLVEDAKRHLTVPVIANFVGVADNIQSWVKDAVALEAAGADALEMDLYCPMTGLGTEIEDNPDGGHGYMSICAFPEALTQVTRALNDAVGIPVIPKMNPAVSSILDTAQALIDGGTTTIAMSNCGEGNPGVDIYTGQSAMPLATKISSIPMMGRYLFAQHNATLALLETTFGKTIQFGTGGGVYTWDEIVQRIMLGGHTVQLCSTIFENGPRVITDSLVQIAAYMDEKGYESISDFRGIALDTVDDRAHTMVKPAVAKIVNPTALAGRGEEIAAKVYGDCLAMSVGAGNLPVIDEKRCTGCGWCVFHAGDGSIELAEVSSFTSDLDLPSLL